MIAEEEKMHFSYDLEATLTEEERKADQKLTQLKSELVNPLFNIVLRDFTENRAQVESSKLFAVLDKMPKGAIHHIHTSAAPPIEVYMSLTYDPMVFYNEREKLFKIFPKATMKEDGYVSCVEMRAYSKDIEAFDNHLKNEILLTKAQTEGKSSHDIWKHFQHKFTKVTELGKYYKFFRTLLKATVDSCTAQNVFVVELRHISGMLFDDNREPMGLIAELDIINEVI
jgi:adenosine deaminase CECR1